MTVIVGLLIGNETWGLMERCIRSLRHFHPDQPVMIYYLLDAATGDQIINTLDGLGVDTVDIGKPGLLGLFSADNYSNFDTAEFNIKTSFKWLALLAAMKKREDSVIFVDADIKIISPLPFADFDKIWQSYDVFVQDEGTSIMPKHPCTGFIGFKYCEANISLLEALHKEHCSSIVSAEGKHDQLIFYEYISRSVDIYGQIYFLPQMLFPVGYLGPIYSGFNPATISATGQTDPVIFHANWTVGIEAKEALMDSFNGHDSGDFQKTDSGQLRLAQERLELFRTQVSHLELELVNVRADLYQEQQSLGMARSALGHSQSEFNQVQSELKQTQSELQQAQSELENLRFEFTEVAAQLMSLRQFETQARHSYKTHASLLWAETLNRWRQITGS